MDRWDVAEEFDALQPFIEFERSDTGQFEYACVHGHIDCQVKVRDGKSAIEFTIVDVRANGIEES